MENNMFRRIIILLITLLFIGGNILPSAGNIINDSVSSDNGTSNLNTNGETLYVGGGGPGNYSNIQDAIDNASSGDTVFVFSGEYHENVSINKSINLFGEDKTTTIINADFHGDVIYVSADGVTITGFSLTDSQRAWYYGAGIRIESSDNNIVHDNIIVNNFWGLYLINSSNGSILNNSIINNSSSGIRIEHSSYNCLIGDKVIEDGGISLQD